MALDTPAPDTAQPAANVIEYTVSELAQLVRRSVEDAFGYVRVRGEVSNLRRPGSGHLYFDLKDEGAVLAAVCWRGIAQSLRLPPEDGLEVVCTGKLSTYPAQSRYQIVVESVVPAGLGALMALLEERKKKLDAEGLFAEERKRPIPFLPEVVGVVTSPTGAVIRDILQRMGDRFPRRVLLWPVLVQGNEAAEQVAAAIEGFNLLPPDGPVPKPDVLIVARGGGSLEDLWPFNEEVVVRAAAASQIPLISAIGHETDTTLIDLAADLRAPTPTAAVEKAVPVRAELVLAVKDLDRRLAAATARLVDGHRTRLEGLARGLPDLVGLLTNAAQELDHWSEHMRRVMAGLIQARRVHLGELAARLRHPRELLTEARARLEGLSGRVGHGIERLLGLKGNALATAAAGLRREPLRVEIAHRRTAVEDLRGRLGRGLHRALADAEARLAAQARLLESCGYEQVLNRGFVLVRDPAGRPVTSARQARPGTSLALTFKDGERRARVEGAPTPRRRRKAPPAQDAQRRLL
ncbi:MAG: exodeoxyribonuclease VII large subunit [Alphaproteobacteria bacterium]